MPLIDKLIISLIIIIFISMVSLLVIALLRG